MKRIKLSPIAIILMLVLGAVPAVAEHRSNPGADRGQGLEHLSARLADTTAALHIELTESRHHWRFHQRIALRKLDKLVHQAKRFERQVARDGIYDRGTRRAYRNLNAAFETASARFSILKTRRSIRHDFAKVAKLMERVETRMARVDHRHHRSHDYHARSFGAHDSGRRVAWNHRN